MNYWHFIFKRKKTDELIKAEIEVQNDEHYKSLRKLLEKDMINFKNKYRKSDVVFKQFNHRDIDKLNLYELSLLGFHSDYDCKRDWDKLGLDK